ncbi:MAG: helix-turn-helix domain-containing protein [Halodesulfurarchaeum sp.]|nr:helix-turn-helix domain-containing protein [Halodesulfurarchaeum sp.]
MPELELTPQTVTLDGSTKVFDALAAGTTREILRQLHDEPTTTGEIAKIVGTSIQNADYHLQKLEQAGLVQAVDTWYSPKGREMDVYAPCHQPLVMVFDDDHDGGEIEETFRE